MNAMPPIDVDSRQWTIVRDILLRRVPSYEVWAFGSRVKGTARKYSDLDLCVVTRQPMDLGLRAVLAEDFAESDLPWKVDVVDWATTSEAFRKIIESDKVVLQRA